MPVTTDPAHRADGLIYLDPALADRPATHVLLVGVGRFDVPKNPAIARLAPLTSPPASARALAAWFLDGTRGKPGFHNPDRPLGSLSLLLSEGAGPATAEGGPVPEATFANVKAAVEGWATRAMAHDASASILLMSSHGQAFNRQTAVLFQDYGSSPLDPYAGMTEVEQLTDALSTLPPADKLMLIDCCRLPTDLDLIPGRTYGTALIGGRPRTGMEQTPQVLRSTRLGAAAYGAGSGRPTLFTGALLEGLAGAAAAPNEDWQIDVNGLWDTASQILMLWQDDGEQLQAPVIQQDRQMVISQAPETDRVGLFVVLPEGADLATVRASATPADDPTAAPLSEANGPQEGEPFLRLWLPQLRPCRVAAFDAAGALVGERMVKAVPPWRKVVLPPPGTQLPGGVAVTRAKSADGEGAGASLSVNAEMAMGLPQSPVLRVTEVPPAAAPMPPPPPFPLPSGPAPVPTMGIAPSRPPNVVLDRSFGAPRRTRPRVLSPEPGKPLHLPPGQWMIRTSRPGAPMTETLIEVADGDEVTLDLPAPRTGHEWLSGAVLAGVIGPGTRGGPFASDPAPDPAVLLHGPDLAPVTDATLQRAAADGRLALYTAHDRTGERFALGQTGPDHRPVWADLRGAGWRERCFVPLQGAVADFAQSMPDGRPDLWRAEVLVDDGAPSDRSHVAGYVANGRWGALLAFLARRSFLDAGAALRNIAADMPLREAVVGKVTNPLAALAAAQIAVATRQTAALDIPDGWLENLANWFPTLPDGAVIHGRHLMQQGKPDAAATAFATAFDRGLPVFSLCVDWLSQGLAATGHNGADAARARALATDPTRAFTVIRLTEGDP